MLGCLGLLVHMIRVHRDRACQCTALRASDKPGGVSVFRANPRTARRSSALHCTATDMLSSSCAARSVHASYRTQRISVIQHSAHIWQQRATVSRLCQARSSCCRLPMHSPASEPPPEYPHGAFSFGLFADLPLILIIRTVIPTIRTLNLLDRFVRALIPIISTANALWLPMPRCRISKSSSQLRTRMYVTVAHAHLRLRLHASMSTSHRSHICTGTRVLPGGCGRIPVRRGTWRGMPSSVCAVRDSRRCPRWIGRPFFKRAPASGPCVRYRAACETVPSQACVQRPP